MIFDGSIELEEEKLLNDDVCVSQSSEMWDVCTDSWKDQIAIIWRLSLLFCWKCENVLVLDRQLDIIFIARLKNSNIHFNKKVRYTFKNICLCRDFNFGVPIFCVFRKEIRLIFKFIGKMFVGKCFYLKGCCTIEHIKTFASSKLVRT